MSSSKGKETREILAKSALKLFLSHGYDHVTLKQIAEDAELSKGGLTHHFDSKTELLKAAVEYFFGAIQKMGSESSDGSAETFSQFLHTQFQGIVTINNILANITGIDDTALNYHQVFLDSRKHLNDFDITEVYFRPSIAAMEQQLVEFKEKGELSKDVDPKTLAFQILTTMEGAYIFQFYDESIDMSKRMKQLADDIIGRVST